MDSAQKEIHRLNSISHCATCNKMTSKAGNYVCKSVNKFRYEMSECPENKWKA